ncbi:MAG: hypothetical protein ACK5QH_04110 [Rubrivivax sp.]|jgi:hypothetical protein
MRQTRTAPPRAGVWLKVGAACTWCVLALLSACGGGSGEGLDANGRPLSEGGGPVASAATLAALQANVFTPVCAGCHAGATAPAGLRLDTLDNSYSQLVGVSSVEVSSLRRVNPGNPNDSYLVQKLEGSAAVGARMPFGGPYLDAATIALVRQWIADGALKEPRP